MCVHTNDGYVVVAVVVVEREDSTSLTEVLQLLAKSVLQWTPMAFIIDASEIEVTATKATFPGKQLLVVCLTMCYSLLAFY